MNVRQDLFITFSALENYPLIIFGLLPNEHKMSVLNLVLKHTNISPQPVKSKEKLIFQCGFRRFTACPIFSQHTNGNKHKVCVIRFQYILYVIAKYRNIFQNERYFRPESTVVASMFAPITFPPCPVLCYIQKLNKSLVNRIYGRLPLCFYLCLCFLSKL